MITKLWQRVAAWLNRMVRLFTLRNICGAMAWIVTWIAGCLVACVFNMEIVWAMLWGAVVYIIAETAERIVKNFMPNTPHQPRAGGELAGCDGSTSDSATTKGHK